MKDKILPKLKGKKRQIPQLFYRFRFLNRIHIQKLFNQKNHRNILTWINYLTSNHYIEPIEIDKNEHPLKNIAPTYYIGVNGIQYLKMQPGIELIYLKRLKQEKRKTLTFQNECIFIVETYLSLRDQAKDKQYNVTFYTPMDYPIDGEIQDLKPSFVYVKESKRKIEHFACEFIDDMMPRRILKARLEKFHDFFSIEEENSVTNIIFICQSDKKCKQIKYYANEIFDQESKYLKCYVTTFENWSDLQSKIS